MVSNTLSRLAGLAAFALMVARLGRLFEAGGGAPSWHLILGAAAFLGGVVWWLLSETMSSRRGALGLFGVTGILLFLRISVAQTLLVGFFPGPDTLLALMAEMGESFDIMRFGVSPVYPGAGLIAILAVVMWVIGALFAWGASHGPVAAMSLPSIAMYLQFAVIDRAPAGRGWMGMAAAIFALSVAAIANDRKSAAGRVRDSSGRPIPRHGGSLALAMAGLVAVSSVALATSASQIVSESGNINWRSGGGYGEGFGGISFNRLVGLQKRVISRSNAELFRVTFDENAPEATQIYYRMETLSRYDGQSWLPDDDQLERYSPATAGGDPDHAYQGTTVTFTQRIRIEALRGPLVPTAGIARALQSDTENINQFQVAPDGSLINQSQLDEGMTYQVEADYPIERADLNALATGPDGELTPLFAEAGRIGAFAVEPAMHSGELDRPTDIDRYLELPNGVSSAIPALAREVTRGARSDFERATLLQHWFRDSGTFIYSTDVTAGHTDLQLADWLTEETSQDYRTGYCEQFAASMAVLGRALNVPSRVVWGFTPGDEITQSDGTTAIVVRDNNAHAWVEMWMDGFGWVKFDPTPRSDGALPQSFTAEFDPSLYVADPINQPTTIDQPGFDDDSPLLGLDDTDLGGAQGGDSSGTLPTWVLSVPLLILMAFAIPLLKGLRRRRRMATIRTGDITAAWDEIVDQLSDLGERIPEHNTPIEFALATDRSLVPVARAYGAAIYGRRANEGKVDDFLAVEHWIKLRYEGGRRMRARFNPSSLLQRRRQ
ncbi:MAG: transglutaminase domain-containing protein [Acidimicrobiia bacterium]